MLRALCLTMTVLLLPVGHGFAETPPDLAANAALKYWQAFALLPRTTEAEERRLSAESLTMPMDESARKLITKAEYALEMLRYGAALPRCEWGLAWKEQGIQIRLPQADAGRVLASLACLRARLLVSEGRSAEAIDDIIAAMTLARHTSQNAVNILVLTGYAIEHRMIETLALALPKLNAEQIKDLKKRLDALPPSGSPATGLPVERKWALDWFIRKVKETKDNESLLALLRQCSDSEGKARAFLEASGGTAEGVVKTAEELLPCYARMTRSLELPLDQFAKEWEIEERKQANNPVFKVLFPAIDKMRWQQARIEVRRALLSAALAVQLEGRAALQNHPDPVAGGPFDYVPFEGGFELRSKLKPDDQLRARWKLDERSIKPLTLTVGQHGN